MPITMVLAYGQRQDYAFQIHRPEICYPASGFSIENSAERIFQFGASAIPGNLMQARRGRRQETVLYWTRIGNAFPQSLTQQRLAVLADITDWRVAEGALMRLSIPTDSMAAGAPILQRFADNLIQAIAPMGRKMLIGPVT